MVSFIVDIEAERDPIHEFLLCIFTLQTDLRRCVFDLPARSQLRVQILTLARLGRNLRAGEITPPVLRGALFFSYQFLN